MDENQFAEYFVIIHQNKIKQDLQIKYLNTDTTAKIIAEFFKKDNMLPKLKNQQHFIHNKSLYKKILNILQTNDKLEMTPDEYIKHLENKLYKHGYIE